MGAHPRPPAPDVLAGYRDVAPPDETFEQRARWDQLGALARRFAEPDQRSRLHQMIEGH